MDAVLDDWRTAPLSSTQRAAFDFLEKLTLEPEGLGTADADALREAGARDEAIEDVIRVGFLFNLIDRVADALGFELPSPKTLEHGAKLLLRHGYGK